MKAEDNKFLCEQSEAFCDECEHLHPKEHEQTKDKETHRCMRVMAKVYHHSAHPHIPVPEWCPKAKDATIARLKAKNASLREEVERYRAVLEGAEYRNIDNLKNESVEKCRAIGAMAALLTFQLRTRAEQAEAALRELYTYPGVRDLLAPTDSLGSIARRVEHVLK